MEVECGKLKTGFLGIPERSQPRKRKELQNSLEQLGDFGLILIDEQYNIIGGNQRVACHG